MRILHCCLACFYIDGYSYQENILPRYHKNLGHDIKIVASRLNYKNNKELELSDSGSYFNEDGIEVTRLNYHKLLPLFLAKKIRLYIGLEDYLGDFRPEIIFLHDINFMSLITIAKYCEEFTSTIVLADTHTDFVNSASNLFSRNLLHKGFYKSIIKRVDDKILLYYGTTPVRSKFLSEMYGIDNKKIRLLPFGADNLLIENFDRKSLQKSLRRKYNIPESSIIVVSGGKIDKRKNLHELIEAVCEFSLEDVVLILFGIPNDEMNEFISSKRGEANLILVGWLNSREIYEVLLAGDLAIFPGTHSVLWEQAVGAGVPCVFRSWEGMNHIDLGGNCLLLSNGDKKEIMNLIKSLIQDNTILMDLSLKARHLGPKHFSYSAIAEQTLSEYKFV